jgi:hypothetical protein
VIPGATNAILRLENLQLDDAGWYSLFVTDGTSTTEVGVALSVLYPLALTLTESGELKLRANPGARYTLESSSDLKNWSFWKSLTASGEELAVPATPPLTGQIFYRAIAEP